MYANKSQARPKGQLAREGGEKSSSAELELNSLSQKGEKRKEKERKGIQLQYQSFSDM
jgi:hypothetical protein